MTADLERDLNLAGNARAPQTAVVSALEGGPRNTLSGAQRGRRDAVPTLRPQPRPVPPAEVQETAVTSALEEATAPAVAVTATVEPTPTPVPEPVAPAPEPDPVSGPVSRGPSDGRGEMSRGEGRRGGGLGTLIGVIIRGGGAGIDHCEEHDRRRAGRRGGMGGGIIVAGPGGWGGPIGASGGTPRTTFPPY